MQTTWKYISRVLLLSILVLSLFPYVSFAQDSDSLANGATTSATTTEDEMIAVGLTERLTPIIDTEKKDITQPEKINEKVAILSLLESRIVDKPSIFNFFAYWVQQAIFLGIPANTIVLILLTPVIATVVVFVRTILGFKTLELLVPIALAFAFVAVGIVTGLIILSAVLLASYVSRILLKKVSIMFFPKRALSLTLLALFVFAALTATAVLELAPVQNLSIFPIIILTLLGDSIVSVQLHKSWQETVSVTVVTFALGLFGFVLATSQMALDTIILYPELILLTIPANILVGRYFGLRLTEYFRFERLE